MLPQLFTALTILGICLAALVVIHAVRRDTVDGWVLDALAGGEASYHQLVDRLMEAGHALANPRLNAALDRLCARGKVTSWIEDHALTPFSRAGYTVYSLKAAP